MKNKKGISAIVATVLIILITVAAVTIIWAAIIPMIRDQIGGSTECFDAAAALSVVTDFSCSSDASCTNTTDITGGNCADNETVCISGACKSATWENASISVQVHRGTGSFDLEALEIIYGVGGTTDSIEFTNDTTGDLPGLPTINGDRVYDIELTSLERPTEAGVAAIVRAGNTDKNCGKSGVAVIPECA